MDYTRPVPERQPHPADHLGASVPAPTCPRSGTPPQTCPTCGRAYDLFDPHASVLLDWIARLQQDLDHIKRTVEDALP